MKVYVNFNRNISVKKANAIVAAAGPISNLVLAIISSIIMVLVIKFQGIEILTNRALYTVMKILNYIISMNVGLAIFNLIPLPPLDGSKVLSAFVPDKVDYWFKSNEQIFYIIFLVMWITGIATAIISPVISYIYTAIIDIFAKIFNVSRSLGYNNNFINKRNIKEGIRMKYIIYGLFSSFAGSLVGIIILCQFLP